MRGRWLIAALLTILAAATCMRADLKSAAAEPNLEKRSKLALDNAASMVKQAREAYGNGDFDRTRTLISEALESVELAHRSLEDTHKDPRRSPKWFKKAELELRELSRKADAFNQEMSFTDRGMIEQLRTRILQVHESVLTGLMEGRKK